MQLKSIKISNIRSIKSMSFTFPPATTLFYGDVGHGKSSVLKAIEFALFGIMESEDLSGDSLLRRGEKRGFVELEFSVDGEEYTVHRDLEVTGTNVQQGKKGTLIAKGVKREYSPQELRGQVLKILHYNVKYVKAQKIPLFRYTVYTPQEQLKDIIFTDAKSRFKILKEVFDITKYETILANVGTIDDLLKKKIDATEKVLLKMGDPEKDLPEKETALEAQKVKVQSIVEALEEKKDEKKREDARLDEIEVEQGDWEYKSKSIKKLEKSIAEETLTIEKLSGQIEDAADDVEREEGALDSFEDVEQAEVASVDDIEAEIGEIRGTKEEQQARLAVLTKTVQDIEKLLADEKCSLCGQKIYEKERFQKEFRDTKALAAKVSTVIEALSKTIADKEGLKAEANKLDRRIQERESVVRVLEQKRRFLDSLKENRDRSKEKIEKDESEISDAYSRFKIDDADEFQKAGEELEQKVDEQQAVVDALAEEVVKLEKEQSAENRDLTRMIEDMGAIKASIELKKQSAGSIDYLKSLRTWIEDPFPLLIRNIEQELLSSTAEKFNEYFKEWFKVLVDDENIDVEINPQDFEPIVTVNGYTSPIKDLSGGEKSALALAYRLALNKIINEKYQEVKTKDLLILDEPTDGFSVEQVNRMQIVFERLGIPQIIIISHERNLDSFVSDIITFTKKNHETTIKMEGQAREGDLVTLS